MNRITSQHMLSKVSCPVLVNSCTEISIISLIVPDVVNTRPSRRYFSTEGNDGGTESDTRGSQVAVEDAGTSQNMDTTSHENAGGRKSFGHGRKTKMAKSLQSAQERVAELLSPGKDTLMLHEDQNYELLGKAEDAPRVVAGASARAQEISPNRIHPHRLFYPGAKYSPEELNPYKAKEVLMRSDLTVRRGNIPKDVVMDQADFRNTEFLTYFLKDSGKLVPRRRTKLPAKLHRELMREIKLARSLGLVDFLSKDTVSKV